MKIYLAQHAVSVPQEQDQTRPVSDAGVADTVQVAAHLARYGISINRVCHSGKLRALQTAEIFAEHMIIPELVQLGGMNPNDEAAGFAGNLTQDGVMYVGHLPHLSKVVSCLICRDQDQGVLRFQNSGVACIEIESGRGALSWYVVPGLC